jgi:hypothetical protein
LAAQRFRAPLHREEIWRSLKQETAKSFALVFPHAFVPQ